MNCKIALFVWTILKNQSLQVVCIFFAKLVLSGRSKSQVLVPLVENVYQKKIFYIFQDKIDLMSVWTVKAFLEAQK